MYTARLKVPVLFWCWRTVVCMQPVINSAGRLLLSVKMSSDMWWRVRALLLLIWGILLSGIWDRMRLCVFRRTVLLRLLLPAGVSRSVLFCGCITVILLLIMKGSMWKMRVIVAERRWPAGMIWHLILLPVFRIREWGMLLVIRMPKGFLINALLWNIRLHGPAVLCRKIRICVIWWLKWSCCPMKPLPGMRGLFFWMIPLCGVLSWKIM